MSLRSEVDAAAPSARADRAQRRASGLPRPDGSAVADPAAREFLRSAGITDEAVEASLTEHEKGT